MLSTTYQYRVAEIFVSIQGEGLFSGAPMDFVRLAGCNVGVIHDKADTLGPCSTVSICHSVDGSEFTCDTDYRVNRRMSAQDIMDAYKADQSAGIGWPLCVTGGEPFLQNMYHLASLARTRKVRMHVETSGTILFAGDNPKEEWCEMLRHMHIVCSPKVGYNTYNSRYVNEWKFVVGPQHPVSYWYDYISRFLERENVIYPLVFIQPVNHRDSVDLEAARIAVKLVSLSRNWRVSIQIHKVLGIH